MALLDVEVLYVAKYAFYVWMYQRGGGGGGRAAPAPRVAAWMRSVAAVACSCSLKDVARRVAARSKR